MPYPNHKASSSTGSLTRLGTGAAIRRGELRISEPLPIVSNSPGLFQPRAIDMDTFPPALAGLEIDKSRKTTPALSYRRNPSVGNIDGYPSNRFSAGPSIVPSSMASALSKTSLSQKKNSGFRATLKRVFGSKRSKPSFNDTPKDYHRSNPELLAFLGQKQPHEQMTRRPSQPVADPFRSSALTSSSPYLSTIKNSDIAQEGSDAIPRRRRRNTLSSLVLSEQEARLLAGKNDDSIPRVPGWSGVQAKAHEFNDSKRRSRSAEALLDMSGEIPVPEKPVRDREDEIAYWRRSAVENPVPTLTSHKTGDSTQNFGQMPTRAPPAALTPIQSFDFGLDDLGRESATLEQRVSTLEIKLYDFEYALANIQGHNLLKPMFNPRLYKRRSAQEIRRKEVEKSPITASSTHDLTFLSSPAESSTFSSNEDTSRQNRLSKATEASTIRPATAKRQSPKTSNFPSPTSVRFNSGQYDTLMSLIQQEQCVRQQMQIQIMDMQRDIEALKSPVYATIRPLDYPTPSPESTHETPIAPRGKTLHRSPPFHIDRPQYETSRFSMTDAGSETTEDGYQDVFETPQENKFAFESPRIKPIHGMI